MSNSERRKTKVETPPMVSKTRRTPPIVSKSRRTQRRPIEARLQGHPLRVNAADLPRRRFLHLAAGAAALPAVSCDANVQSYPSRPIMMIVPFPAGGGSDAAGRIVAEHMRGSLGQSVIIENVGGADAAASVAPLDGAAGGYLKCPRPGPQ